MFSIYYLDFTLFEQETGVGCPFLGTLPTKAVSKSIKNFMEIRKNLHLSVFYVFIRHKTQTFQLYFPAPSSTG